MRERERERVYVATVSNFVVSVTLNLTMVRLRFNRGEAVG